MCFHGSRLNLVEIRLKKYIFFSHQKCHLAWSVLMSDTIKSNGYLLIIVNVMTTICNINQEFLPNYWQET